MANRSPIRKPVEAPSPAPDWQCERCGRGGAEILAAHRLDAIRVAMRHIGGCDEVSRHHIRPYLRKLAKRLRAHYLALLECVDEDIVAADVTGLPTTRCATAVNADCANDAADSAAAIRSVRTQAGIDAIAVFLDEVEDGYAYNALNGFGELAGALGLPELVPEVLMARVVASNCALENIDAFNAWRAAEPLAAKMLEEV